jgi:hypothetical protein
MMNSPRLDPGVGFHGCCGLFLLWLTKDEESAFSRPDRAAPR